MRGYDTRFLTRQNTQSINPSLKRLRAPRTLRQKTSGFKWEGLCKGAPGRCLCAALLETPLFSIYN